MSWYDFFIKKLESCLVLITAAYEVRELFFFNRWWNKEIKLADVINFMQGFEKKEEVIDMFKLNWLQMF